jgi:membrane protein required for colicin V production
MNVVDILVVACLSLFAVRGYNNGLLHELLSMGALFAAFAAAFRWTAAVAPRLAESIPGPAFVDTGLSFLFVFGVVLWTGRYVATVIRRMWIQARRWPANRLAGMSFGVVKGAVMVGAGVLMLRTVAPPTEPHEGVPGGENGPVTKISAQVDRSYLGPRIADLTGGVFSVLMTTADGQVRSLASGGQSAGGL